MAKLPITTKKLFSSATIIDNTIPSVKYVVLEPVGFPIKVSSEPVKVTTDDPILFTIYARDQWHGEIVKKGDYLFDNSILPDYAFKVVSVFPKEGGMITNETVFKLQKPTKVIKTKFKKARFDEIIGQEDAKKKCKIIMKYLQNPELFGEWAPKNVLFYGPPGTGKTMMARALATETDSSFIMVKAPELIGEHVGDSAKMIRELYKKASESAPCIIFIDELDAIGLSREYQSLRGDVAEVVNALLTELDGIKENKGVVTIAATNNPAMLDSAIRSRFEEEIEFKLPNDEERLKIMELYVKKMPLPVKANLKEFVEKTKGFSGRDIKEKLLKPALHRAILEDREYVSKEDLEWALKKAKKEFKEVPAHLYL
ncbi:AAA family ATPase [Methanocaldococcus infernus]|uniref:AAA ATPase central domain protein n=1 Tax=Methanocaldococcus infernus (strain DSM 11812 / JCM 15783 / ME) TaxID=573063 RepID=D5VSL0_METIM|nr:AAA family ATPase [Methanocaldococcus infernus]ADG13563.1 AAA ATPase central domain protein [Methanocaldococcus infernus ME]